METKTLNVELRSKTGKGISRKLRADGRLPGVVYGKGMEPVPVSIDSRELVKTISGDGAINSVITLSGGESLNGASVIIAELTVNPIKGTPKHVDLHKVKMDEKVRVHVQISVKGTAKGVKDGGLLDVVKHSVEIECLPAQIPAHIDVDVTALTIGHSIHVSELKVPASIRLLDDPSAAIVNVLGKAIEEEVVEV